MKVLIIHNDLRAYWRHRVRFLHASLKLQGIDFYALELFGKGSPYDFESFNKTQPWWDCLFPENSHIELNKYQIKDKFFAKLDQIDADVIIGGSVVFYSGALGLRWAKKHGKKFIMFDDGKPSWIKRNFVVQGVKNLITRQVDALWMPSDEYDNEYAPLYSKKNIKYLYGYDCIDNEFFQFAEGKRMDNKKIITVSRLVEKKNVKSLLLAWKYVEEKYSGYSLDILGDGPLLGELKEYTRKLGLKHVNFVGAVCERKNPWIFVQRGCFCIAKFIRELGIGS